MTTRSRAPLLALLGLLAAAPASAQQAEVTMTGRCERLVIGGLDITQNCKEQLVNTVSRGRTTFDFAAWDGQSLSFSGSGAQHEQTEETEQLQPISLVVPGMKNKEGIVRSPAPAVGACKFSRPEPGKTMIACEATSQGKTYAGVFVTDAKPGAEPGKEGDKDASKEAPAGPARP
ncbi:hypothetical protein ABEV34_03270 [Methylorubrum rhodesianum]|jgi:hypothetical protein|uniref:Uncharacterized protein n=1 Tax=Methylorubrum rhodesianum TaxID=29427 RepID=A0ABU9ZB67_9HYPH|nr:MULTISPECIES: hypothetical protein [Methylorubrum]MBB5763883.1 hypothetical protein [Methylorubrum rhodesianum]MBI1690314.1 hypothetical protein [Methylorubrum sp. DB1722]MBK3405061.1 hypothetical protein [Methylorubrum rhodesianum]MBY0138996.1 hypothetical protein [Methylorubrum populi]